MATTTASGQRSAPPRRSSRAPRADAEATIADWVAAADPGTCAWLASNGMASMAYTSPAGLLAMLGRAPDSWLANVATRHGGRVLDVGFVASVALTPPELEVFQAWNGLQDEPNAAVRIVQVGAAVAGYGVAVAAAAHTFAGSGHPRVASCVETAAWVVKHAGSSLLGIDPAMVGRVVATTGGSTRDAVLAALAIYT